MIMETKKGLSAGRIIAWLGLAVLAGGYIFVAGRTNTCSACAAITQLAGVGPVSTPRAEYPMSPLQVGESIPEGMLRNEQMEEVDLAALIHRKPTVLIFYRGGWCPYCNRQLAALSDIEQELRGAGFQLLAISPDRPELLRQKEAMKESPYMLLSDSSMDLSRRFGIAFQVEDELVEKYKNSYKIDLEHDSGYTHHLLPHPSVFIIDTDGKIRFQYTNEDYKVRLEPEKIMEAVRRIQAE